MKMIKLLMVLFSVIAATAAGQNISISGKITDSGTKEGLAYVYVEVKNSSTHQIVTGLTDEKGNFTVKSLQSGDYRLSVSMLGYYPVSVEVKAGDQATGDVSIELVPAMIPLGEVQISSLRYNKLEKDVALPITVVPREYFPRQSSITLSDVLSREPGIALSRDGGWSTSVNIRGLGENRMVSLVDGNRIETASDLVAGLSMFDVNEIERVEIIKGAASSIYGTGALGGVVNILTQKGQFYDKQTIHGSAIGSYQTVNNLLGTHVAVESGSKTWKVRLSGGYRTAGNYKTPDGIQPNSQFNDRDINATIGIRPLANHELEINAQHFQAFNVGIPGGAAFGPLATATYPEERRQLISGKYSIKSLLPLMDEISLRVYHQFILRDVEMIPNTPPVIAGNIRLTAERVLPRGEHATDGLVLETRWKTGENSRLVGGIDLWQRKLVTSRDKYLKQEILDAFQQVKSTMQIIRSEKPNPDSKFGSGGIFIQHESSHLNDKLELTLGARIDRIRVANELGLDPFSLTVDGVVKEPVPGQRVVFEADTIGAWSWSANAGALYHLLKNLDFTANIGRSFRSPSLEERFKYIDLGSKVRLGDPNLKPEKGLFADLGLRIWKERFQLQANGFINYLNDMIVETPGVFIYTLNTGTDAGKVDTLPALKNANVDRALLAGFDASVNYQPFSNSVIYAKAAFVRGINLVQNSDLPLIPPFSTGVGFRYYVPGIFTVEWTTNWVAAQIKIAIGETATESYFLSDFSLYSAAWEAGITSFQIFAGVDNVFNKSYRNHLATNRGMILVEPGRNVYLKLVMRF
ncbi:MAG: TonB-dependent receptor [Bacteroidales bacterium]